MDMVGFCTNCDSKFKSFAGMKECPNCGTKDIPCAYEDQVSVSINWHELRILCMWAERWSNDVVASQEKQEKFSAIYSIIERLRRQHPEKAKKMPLSLASEIQGVVDYFGANNVKHNVPGVEGGEEL